MCCKVSSDLDEEDLTISSRERQNNETEIKKILFDHSRSIDQKMVEIRKIAKNIRLLIGFKTKEEFRETVSMLKANGVSIIALKSYRRPNYFHILAKLHANSPEAQDFIGSFSMNIRVEFSRKFCVGLLLILNHFETIQDVLPFTFGEELVSNDPTALLETGFELIGRLPYVTYTCDTSAIKATANCDPISTNLSKMIFYSGKTLHDIKGMSLDDQLTHFSKKQLAGTEEGLMEKFFIQNLLVTVST